MNTQPFSQNGQIIEPCCEFLPLESYPFDVCDCTHTHANNLMCITNSMHHLCKGKILIWSEYYNQFGIYQRSHVSSLEPQQNNLSNPEAYSQPCQTSKIEFFAKIVNN